LSISPSVRKDSGVEDSKLPYIPIYTVYGKPGGVAQMVEQFLVSTRS
jgi:hypothetical protein